MKRIYLDYAATTPVDEKVKEAMLPFFSRSFGNPSSLHSFGRETRKAIEDSREKTADFLNASAEEIIFTGSATEANNMAIRGVVANYKKPHIITSQIEHPAVLRTCQALEKEGIEVTYLKPDQEGIISLRSLKEEIKENTALVTIMTVNNEVGTIQPIKEIAELLKEKDIIFHTDAVQAANHLDLNVKELGIDLLTLSGHKFYGPKGIGILFKRNSLSLKPLTFGGHQERGLRPGTENVPAIVGLGKALEILEKGKEKELRDKLLKKLLEIERVKLNGSLKKRVPNNINVYIPGIEGEALLVMLDEQGLAVSTGSACSSGDLKASHVLKAMGFGDERAHSSIRITLGKYTTEEEIERAGEIIKETVEKLRKTSGYK